MSDQVVPADEKQERTTPAPRSSRRYLTLSQACRFLGVSDTTLRDWTDAGKIKAFITPGGHRRYTEADLADFVEAQPHVKRLADLIQQLKTVRVEYHILTQEYTRTRLWYTKLDEAARSSLRDHCRLLLDLILAHLTDPRRRKASASTAKELGHGLGTELLRLEFTLTDAIEAFILYRNPTLDTVAELLKSNEPVDRSVVRGIQAINAIIDSVLLGIVEYYQTHNITPESALTFEDEL